MHLRVGAHVLIHRHTRRKDHVVHGHGQARAELITVAYVVEQLWVTTAEVRDKLADYRRHAIQLRRYLAPQREALYRLQLEDATWLTKRDKVRIREVTDRTLRFLEDLDAIRDRTMILHEDLTALVSERIAQTSNRLTAITAMALPPTLLAGVYGMNLEGIPWHGEPWAFGAVCAIILAMFPIEIWFLKRLKWL